VFEAMDGGYYGAPAQNEVGWLAREAALAKLRFSDTQKFDYVKIVGRWKMLDSKDLRQVSGKVLEYISLHDFGGSTEQLLKRKEIKQLVNEYPRTTQEIIVGYTQDTRKFLDDLIDMQNLVRTKRGRQSIPHRQNYLRWIVETNIGNKKFNRRETRGNQLKNYRKETDLLELVVDYCDTAARDMFYEPLSENTRAHAKVMRSKGLADNADWMEIWAGEFYAGVSRM
jgi:hypothetical protein